MTNDEGNTNLCSFCQEGKPKHCEYKLLNTNCLPMRYIENEIH